MYNDVRLVVSAGLISKGLNSRLLLVNFLVLGFLFNGKLARGEFVGVNVRQRFPAKWRLFNFSGGASAQGYRLQLLLSLTSCR